MSPNTVTDEQLDAASHILLITPSNNITSDDGPATNRPCTVQQQQRLPPEITDYSSTPLSMSSYSTHRQGRLSSSEANGRSKTYFSDGIRGIARIPRWLRRLGNEQRYNYHKVKIV